ncbi:MAG: hypothetical protein JKY96_09220 [Phycisphaerales bacterium]|nr:hypothetical protein [Phycisphaerales bacterium]
MNMKKLIGALVATAAMTASAFGQEITVQNDTLVDGGTVSICPCFAAGEEAAVWLTSPCDGNIVAFQIFWKSQLGGAAQTLEESIKVYEGGVFPNPGALKDELFAPLLTDGGLNEFRFRDDNQTIPISIPVSAGEEFVLSLKFGVANAGQIFQASIADDANGCQGGKNAVKVDGITWTNACALGVGGDWVIRAVIDCTGDPFGSACMPDGSCVDGMTEDDAINLGAVWGGLGSDCATTICDGACFIAATEQCLQFTKATCDAVGGTWAGPGTVDCDMPCAADITGEGNLNLQDVFAFLALFNSQDPLADIAEPFGTFNLQDVFAYLGLFNMGCP